MSEILKEQRWQRRRAAKLQRLKPPPTRPRSRRLLARQSTRRKQRFLRKNQSETSRASTLMQQLRLNRARLRQKVSRELLQRRGRNRRASRSSTEKRPARSQEIAT